MFLVTSVAKVAAKVFWYGSSPLQNEAQAARRTSALAAPSYVHSYRLNEFGCSRPPAVNGANCMSLVLPRWKIMKGASSTSPRLASTRSVSADSMWGFRLARSSRSVRCTASPGCSARKRCTVAGRQCEDFRVDELHRRFHARGYAAGQRQVRLPRRIAAVLGIAQAGEDVGLLHPRHERIARVEAGQQPARAFAQPALVGGHGLQRLFDVRQFRQPRVAGDEEVIEVPGLLGRDLRAGEGLVHARSIAGLLRRVPAVDVFRIALVVRLDS